MWQELGSVSYRAGHWEVLQRGGASLTQLWDSYRASEDAEGYAKTLVSWYRGVSAPLLRRSLALSEETAQVLPSSQLLQSCLRSSTLHDHVAPAIQSNDLNEHQPISCLGKAGTVLEQR